MKNLFKKKQEPERTVQYKNDFLQPTEFLARNGKTAYISKEFHQNITNIVFMLGDGKITISDYLHNVLKEHFLNFGEDIKTMYNEKQKPIL